MTRRLSTHERRIVSLAANVAARHFHIFRPQVFQPNRGHVTVATARQVAMYLAHIVGQVPINRLALAFKRDLSSITHNIRLIEDNRGEPGTLSDAELTYLELLFEDRAGLKQRRAA